MPYTNCKVHMEFVDTTAQADGMFSVQDNFIYGDAELLREKGEYPDYALSDLNQFILDGSREILNVHTRLPFVSSQASANDCTFSEQPTVTVDFTERHTSAGLTLYFIQDYPAELKITWYELTGNKMAEETFFPNMMIFFCRRQADGYGKIKITFIRTRLPGQRVGLGHIKYGTEIEWNEENIQTGSLHEEMDVTSAILPINTAEITIVDEEDDFDLRNQNGAWKSIQKKQEVTVVEQLGDKNVGCGIMFIDTWSSRDNTVTFSLIDRLGVIDKTKYYDGRIYNGEKAGAIIDEIMLSAGVAKYTVTDEVREIPVSGHLAICTHRAALQQIAFACGAVVDCGRSDSIDIYQPSRYAHIVLGPDRKFSTALELDKYVSGVGVSYNTYALATQAEEIYNDMLYTGDNRIEFSDPYHPESLSVSAGEIVMARTNYVVIRMTEDTECTLTGRKYEKREITYTTTASLIDAGEEENVISFAGCTLMNAGRVKEIARNLLNFYQLRQLVDVEYILDTEKAGNWVNLRDMSGKTVTSGIISQDIDLTGGFLATAKCRGYSKVVTEFSHAKEIYAGERGLI